MLARPCTLLHFPVSPHSPSFRTPPLDTPSGEIVEGSAGCGVSFSCTPHSTVGATSAPLLRATAITGQTTYEWIIDRRDRKRAAEAAKKQAEAEGKGGAEMHPPAEGMGAADDRVCLRRLQSPLPSSRVHWVFNLRSFSMVMTRSKCVLSWMRL